MKHRIPIRFGKRTEKVKELESVFVDCYMCIYIDIFIYVCILLRGSPTSDEGVIYRVWSGSRFQYPSDTIFVNDRSDAGDHCDNHSHIIGIEDELIYTMWSGL